jgi:GTP pyrophosphokinase
MKKENPDLEKFSASLPEQYTHNERDMVKRAYLMAEKAHTGQFRASGEPYIKHCIAVAAILSEMHVQAEVVAAALLHDTVEDTPLTLGEIRAEFDESVQKLVDGVTKLANLPRVSRDDLKPDQPGNEEDSLSPEQLSSRKKQISQEAQRKMFLAMNDDVRVVLIKLADRLHNMRTLGYTKPDKQKRVAQETLDIFAPLASRLGIWQMKWELEDLALRYVDPQKYKEIATQLNERRDTREEHVQVIVQNLQKILEQAGIKAEVSGRPKHIYSIYRKMMQKGKSFDEVTDIRGVRLVVPDIPACYATLGIIHNHWRPIPNEFDDYIAAPKDNFYQSLHTAVIHDDGKPLEVQIRTPEMHQNSEYGIAAHWRYKEGLTRDQRYEKYLMSLRTMMEWQQDVSDSQEFVESMKTDVFRDRVYVFTPKGDIIDLPGGSTPIDFAYHVHTDVGHHCRGAKADGKLVPLDYQLKTGQRVDILTSKHGGPSRDWLNPSLGLVATQRARSKIKLWFKKQDREQNLAQGREMLEKELQRLGLTEVNLENLAHQLDYKNPDDLFVDLGCGDLSTNKIISLLSQQEENEVLEITAPAQDTTSTDAVSVVGLKGILTQMGRCCNPTPGDPIIGYITRGRGATIHRQDCPNILRMQEKERLVRVSWGEFVRTYPVPIRVTAYDRQGLMGDISNLLNNEGVNIVDVNVKIDHNSPSVDVADLKLIVEVRDVAQLSRLLTRIEALPNVLEAQRQRAG